MLNIFKNRLFLSASLGHASIDVFNSAGPVLLAFFSTEAWLNLNNAQIGAAASLYLLFGAIAQPFFGWLADRYGGRWLAGPSVAWTVGLMVLASILAQGQSFTLFLIVYCAASFGSAAFHPVGTMNASLQLPKHTATATALFFLFGQFGLAGGPTITGYILEHYGPQALQILALLVIPVVFYMLTSSYPSPQDAQSASASASVSDSTQPKAQTIAWGAIMILILLLTCRSWAQIGTVNFTPKLFQDKGWSPTDYGSITSVMWIASAITGVLAGNLADRFGRRQVIFWSLLAAVPPLYFLPIADGWFAYVLAILVGGLTGANHSILVIIIQDLYPGRKALASGLALGLIFGLGAASAYLIGLLADGLTLPVAVQLGAAFAFVGAFAALALPQTRRVEDVSRNGF